MSKIPRQFIDSVLERTDIVSLIEGSVPLKKSGREFSACCPFHAEKSPSFTVSPTKQFYHCFGCGAHGNAISFLMEYERLDFMEALKTLCTRCGLSLPEIEQHADSSELSSSLYDVLKQASTFYHQLLLKSQLADPARQYLKQRGVSSAIAKTFEIGFAPAEWNALSQHFAIRQADPWLQAGLLIQKDQGRFYDRFRNRVMFPIRNRKGDIIGFGGRVLNPEEKPKYLNSPESPVFHKGHELYGLYQTLQNKKRPDYLLAVEGYMDVIALYQHGITAAVATLGTALTNYHLEQLFRYTADVVLCFDGDNAGQNAAQRALDIALPFLEKGRSVRFMWLPEGDDPDTWVRKIGKEVFEQHIHAAKPLATFLIESISKECDLTQLDGQIKLVQIAKSKLEKTTDPLIRHQLIQELARKTRTDMDTLLKALNPETLPEQKFISAVNTNPPPKSSLIYKTLRLLLQYPQLARLIDHQKTLQGLQLPGVALVQHLLDRLSSNPNLSIAALIEDWRGTSLEKHLPKLMSLKDAISEEEARLELKGAISRLDDLKRQQELDELLQKSRSTLLNLDEKNKLKELLNNSPLSS